MDTTRPRKVYSEQQSQAMITCGVSMTSLMIDHLFYVQIAKDVREDGPLLVLPPFEILAKLLTGSATHVDLR